MASVMVDGFPSRNVRTQTSLQKVKLNSSTANVVGVGKNLIIQSNLLRVVVFYGFGVNRIRDHIIIDRNNSVGDNQNVFATTLLGYKQPLRFLMLLRYLSIFYCYDIYTMLLQ